MTRMLLVLVLAGSFVLAGCETKEDTGAVVGAIAGGVVGNQFGKGGGRVAGTMVGAVLGGILGSEVGRKLDARDRELASRAEYDAWERGPSGRPVRWRNPETGRYGEITPDKPYRRGTADCRDYTHKVYIDGTPQAMRGTACRNPDGTWTNVS